MPTTEQPSNPPSSILYQNASATITLLDIPRSIELSQTLSVTKSPTTKSPATKPQQRRRLISTPPLEEPFPSLEPKTAKAKRNVPQASVQELLLRRHLGFALDEVRAFWGEEWCLERVYGAGEEELGHVQDEGGERGVDVEVGGKRRKKRKAEHLSRAVSTQELERGQLNGEGDSKTEIPSISATEGQEYIFHQNPHSQEELLSLSTLSPSSKFHIPPHASFIQGFLPCSIPHLKQHAPQFDLAILDPPWPNRSARRRRGYPIAYDQGGIEDLLCTIPLETQLAEGALVGVWVTNRQAFREMVCGEGGMFERWGVRFVEEWVWVKVTKGGEAVMGMGGGWRRPYEILLVGRKDEGGVEKEEVVVKRRVIIGVPDLHSRKPNLRELFEGVMGKGKRDGGYEALEVFARNLTAGWWSLGDEVLKFQGGEFWVDSDISL